MESEAMSKDLKKRGFKFVGPVICYAFMQAVGQINDHSTDCHAYAAARDRRSRRRIGMTVCACLLYTSPSPRDQRGSRMPSSA